MNQTPRTVSIERTPDGHRLHVDGTPFFVKGAGGAHGRIADVAAHGGNSIRTWSTRDAVAILDEAEAAGVMVLMGLRMVPGRHGFDYSDPGPVADQLARVRGEVERLKDHPALLAWGIGNELNLSSDNPDVWNAVNDVAAMIHEVDGKHPATTMLAGVAPAVVAQIDERAPELDFLCVQLYGPAGRAPELTRAAGYDRPYLITEWGPTGHWESPLTDWGAPVEQTSSEKADAIIERYRAAVLADGNCMGSYIFLWGQKQERTPTWYGLITEAGREVNGVEAMHYLWTGEWPSPRWPRLNEIFVDGSGRTGSVRVSAGQEVTAKLDLEFPDDASRAVTVECEILPEATVLGEGGDYEPRPEPVAGRVTSADTDAAVFIAPSDPGAYRLFVYIHDEDGHSATANLPFHVT